MGEEVGDLRLVMEHPGETRREELLLRRTLCETLDVHSGRAYMVIKE
jgi:hypothetical protein